MHIDISCLWYTFRFLSIGFGDNIYQMDRRYSEFIMYININLNSRQNLFSVVASL